MKQTLALILLLVYTLLGFWIPEYADTTNFIAIFANITAMAMGISVFTEAIKKAVSYDSELHWKHYPKVISIFVALILGFFAYFIELPGIFAEMTTWIEVTLVSLITWGLSRGFYDSDFGYMLIKLALRRELTN